MSHWTETAQILSRLADIRAAGGRAALATVVRIVGSAYRRPGAKLLIEEGGGTLGSVSGGCLEGDVREVARGVLAEGQPRLLHYDTAADEAVLWGLGLGCNGQIDVFVQPATEGSLDAVAGAWRLRLEGEETVVVATVVGGAELLGTTVVFGEARAQVPEAAGLAKRATARLPTGSGCEEVDGRQVFFEVLTPPRHLVVIGAGDDAMPLVGYAADAGFRVTVVDHRPALLAAGRFPGAWRTVLARPEDAALLPEPTRSLAVVKTHSLVHDREWARRLLATDIPYIGLLGPRLRTEAILQEIGREGDERVFGPVGLDLGADGPHQVALAIVAELLVFSAGRRPGHLCERRAAIHAG